MSSALEIVQDSPADLVNSLKARLATTDEEKKAAFTRFKELDDEIRAMLKKAPSRDELPRGADGDKLKKEMKDLETKRTTTSMTLNQEKQIIKELEAGQKQLKLLKKYDIFQTKLDELKEQRQEADDIFKNKKHSSGDMKSGLARLEISGKLNMQPTEIITEVFEFPGEFIGRVIGKKGAGKLAIEDQCNVELNIDAKAADENGGMAKAKIMGSEDGIKKCIEILTTISESVKEDFSFSSDKQFSLLLRNKGELLKKAQEDFTCRIDLLKDEDKKPTGKMTVEGLAHNIAKCKKFLKEKTSGFKELAVEKEMLPALIGAKGVVIRAIQDDSGAIIDIIRDDNSFHIRGSNEQVAAAIRQIKSIMEDNKEVSWETVVDKEYIPAIVGSKGVTIQKMQQDSGFAKFDIIKDDPDRPIIRIRGREEQLEKGKEVFQEVLKGIEKCYRKMACPEALMPVIIGKAGANIKKLQEDSGCPRISYDKANGCLKIKCEEDDYAALDKAEELIKVIMKENEITEIKISQTMINALLNKKGEQINLIAAETELRINVNKESGKLVLKGKEEAVAKAKEMLAELELVNQEDEVPVADEDFSLIIGKGGAVIQGLQADSGCSMDISKETNSIKLRGSDEQLKKGVKLINAILNGGEDGLTAVIEGVAPEAMGACVGKGGAVIKKLQEENKVKLDLLRTRCAIRIRVAEGGDAAGVAKCREEVETILVGVKVTCIIPVRAKPASDKWSLMLDIGREADVSVQFKEDFTQGGGGRGKR
jgi:polyribonucleotide nucleotidyltransferase